MAKLKLEQEGALGVLTLCDPPMNLIGLELLSELKGLLADIEALELRALVLRAEGEHFSAGADVKLFKGLSANAAGDLLGEFLETIQRFEALPFPTLGAVQGLCIAGGLELVLACDLIWAAESARFAQAEVLIGTVPLGGGAQRLAERCGPARAREIVMTGQFYDAATFERWNIINRVVADQELAEKSMKFGQRLAMGPTQAYQVTKRLMLAQQGEGLARADRLTVELAPALFESEDMQAGIRAFLEKGPGQAKFLDR